jgi:hypothetical protein
MEEDSGYDNNSDVSADRLRDAGYDSEGVDDVDDELELQQAPQPQASKDSGIPCQQQLSL